MEVNENVVIKFNFEYNMNVKLNNTSCIICIVWLSRKTSDTIDQTVNEKIGRSTLK